MCVEASGNSSNLHSKPCLHALMVTMGKHGFVIVRKNMKGKADEPLLFQTSQSTDPVVGLHFGPPSTDTSGIISVSGAGDCLASGFLFGVVSGLGVNACAAFSLQSVSTVPSTIASIEELHVMEPSVVHV